MHRLVEDFQKFENVKSSLKAIAENAGKDMSNVPFAQYNDVFSTLIGKPTLNTPSIEFNANGGYMYILDGANGNFTDSYDLYLNGEKSTTLTATSILMQEYGITETDEIAVKAVGTLFNDSPMATARWSDLELGTIGLVYDGNLWVGIGTATDTNIKVAGIVNGIAITSTASSVYAQISNKKIILPEGMTSFGSYFTNKQSNFTIVFGASFSSLGVNAIQNPTNAILDFRKVQKVVSSGLAMGGTYIAIIVPDNLYDDWIASTNWVNVSKYIVKASIYEAQQGE